MTVDPGAGMVTFVAFVEFSAGAAGGVELAYAAVAFTFFVEMADGSGFSF